MRILALDVGNTSVAAALFERSPAAGPPDFTEHRPRAGDESREIEHWLAIARAQGPERVVVGSVHRFGGELARGLENGLGVRPRLLDRGDGFPLRADVEAPRQVGVDRLASALAAFALAYGPALIVNAGTAITVDWVDAGPSFRGGAIVPGRRLQARALHQHTDRLPEIEPWSGARDALPLRMPGRSTEEAIRHGLDVGIPGQVAALLADLTRAAGAALPVFVSGGDGQWLASRLAESHGMKGRARVEPFLAARGFALASLASEPAS